MFTLSSVSRYFLGLTLLVLCCGCEKKADPAQASRSFFQQLFEGKVKEAYDGAAFGFQTLQTESAFEANAREMGLTGGKAVEIGTPKIDGRTAKVESNVTTSKGEKASLIVTLQDERGAWRVYSIRTPRSIETGLSENRFTLVGKGLAFNDATHQPLPDEKTTALLVRDNLLQFNNAIRTRSFTDFYNFVAVAWQAQLTEKQLQRAFQGFIDQNVDISTIKDLEPVFDNPPMISSDGLLLVSGHYPTKPYVVTFSLKFIYELPDWKLFGLDVDLRQQ